MGSVYAEEVCMLGSCVHWRGNSWLVNGHFSQLTGVASTGLFLLVACHWSLRAGCWLLFTAHWLFLVLFNWL